ncbi:ribonuclease E/G [Algihabitans albus]|uniref:ribonuclease E/G n=1 Tax=Algihabitans albus TaxID=2164067 RepID=UPI0013C31CE8|nr:ribonuclease E/G [Algihabitans albus]
MSGRLLISLLPGELRAARLAKDGRLRDYLVQREGDGGASVGDIWVARVLRLQKNLGAFVALGEARPALLDWADCPAGLNEGATVTVRVTRLAQAGKGARVKPAEPPSPLPQIPVPPHRIARGDDPLTLLGQDIDEILCDDSDRLAELRRVLPEGVTVRLRGPRPPLFDADLEAEIAELLAREVPLSTGGRLLIEPVETLTAIDVDSGGAGGAGGALDTNLAAAGEIARQVRLRGLSGLIVVDFLEMGARSLRDRLHRTLKTAFAGDPVETSVFPPLPSGLVEIARQRRRPALHEVLCRPTGWRISPATEAYEALRKALTHPPAAQLTLTLPAAAIAELQGPLTDARQAVEARLGAALILRPSDPASGEASEIFAGKMPERDRP